MKNTTPNPIRRKALTHYKKFIHLNCLQNHKLIKSSYFTHDNIYILNFEQGIFVEHQFLWILLILVHPQNQMSFERLPWVFLLLYHCQKTCL